MADPFSPSPSMGYGDDFGLTDGVQTVEPTVSVEDVGPCRKKITIEVDREQVTSQLSQTMDGLAATARLPGFRPGKAPRHLVEKRFGKSARDEAKQRLVSQAYSKAIETKKLRVLGDPEGGAELAEVDLDGSAPLKFSVEVEVAPEFTLPPFEGISITRPIIAITDEMVEVELDRLCANEGTLEPRPKSSPGDYCTGHGKMVKDSDGSVIHDIEGAVIQIPPVEKKGAGMILGVLVSDLGKQAGLPAPGQSVTVRAKGPENHEVEAIRGEALTMTFEVKEVATITPAKVADLVARLGFEDEGGLRERIKRTLQQRALVEQQTALRNQAAMHLVERTRVDLPQRLTARQAARNLERRRLEMMYRGADAAQVEEHIAELRAASAAVAQRELMLFFILDKAAREMNVGVTEAEVNARVAQLAQSRGERPENLRSQLIQSGQINGVAQQIREHKTLDQIIAKAKISEAPVDEFNRQMAARKAGGAGAEPAPARAGGSKKKGG